MNGNNLQSNPPVIESASISSTLGDTRENMIGITSRLTELHNRVGAFCVHPTMTPQPIASEASLLQCADFIAVLSKNAISTLEDIMVTIGEPPQLGTGAFLTIGQIERNAQR